MPENASPEFQHITRRHPRLLREVNSTEAEPVVLAKDRVPGTKPLHLGLKPLAITIEARIQPACSKELRSQLVVSCQHAFQPLRLSAHHNQWGHISKASLVHLSINCFRISRPQMIHPLQIIESHKAPNVMSNEARDHYGG